MDQVIIIVLLATLFAICFGAVEIYIRLNDEKIVWLLTEIVAVALMLFFGSLVIGFITFLGLDLINGLF